MEGLRSNSEEEKVSSGKEPLPEAPPSIADGVFVRHSTGGRESSPSSHEKSETQESLLKGQATSFLTLPISDEPPALDVGAGFLALQFSSHRGHP